MRSLKQPDVDGWEEDRPRKKKEFLRVIVLPLSSFLYSFIISLPSAVTLLLSSVGWFDCETQTCRKSVYINSVFNSLFWSKPLVHVSATITLPLMCFYFRGVSYLMGSTGVALDFLVVCHFDGRGRRNYVIIYYYPLFFIFIFEMIRRDSLFNRIYFSKTIWSQ